MTSKDYPRLIISAGILLLFAVAFLRHSDNALLIGALISMATGATQFWLGSSKGSSDKSAQLEEMQSARSVKIDQPPDQPVPVDPK